MKDILKDVVKHTHDLGFIEAVKIEGNDSGTHIEAMETERQVVLYGKLHNDVPDLSGTSGASNLGYLKWLLTWNHVNDDASTMEVNRQERNGVEQPVELEFKGADATPWYYRFMSSELVESQLRTVKFKGVEWDVEFNPSVDNMRIFNEAATGIMMFEPTFSISLEDGDLVINFGSGANAHRGKIIFARNIAGKLTKKWSWPIDKVLGILKLADTGNCKISIADAGAMQITIDSGIGSYNYILPARA